MLGYGDCLAGRSRLLVLLSVARFAEGRVLFEVGESLWQGPMRSGVRGTTSRTTNSGSDRLVLRTCFSE